MGRNKAYIPIPLGEQNPNIQAEFQSHTVLKPSFIPFLYINYDNPFSADCQNLTVERELVLFRLTNSLSPSLTFLSSNFNPPISTYYFAVEIISVPRIISTDFLHSEKTLIKILKFQFSQLLISHQPQLNLRVIFTEVFWRKYLSIIKCLARVAVLIRILTRPRKSVFSIFQHLVKQSKFITYQENLSQYYFSTNTRNN